MPLTPCPATIIRAPKKRFHPPRDWHTPGTMNNVSTKPEDARLLSGDALAAALHDSRARTWALVSDLMPAQWLPPLLDGINPIAWELAHLAWFAEFWVLRGPHGRNGEGQATAHLAARFAGPDAQFDSARLAHAERWTTPLLTRGALEIMLVEQLRACIEALPHTHAAGATTATGADDDALYLHRLALFHEDMHGEAFCWLRATLGYPAPTGMAVPQVPHRTAMVVRGGEIQLGSSTGAPGFAFDNERPGREVTVRDFEIDSAPVTALEFARFVNAGGYDEANHWPGAAGAWRAQSGLSHPQHWRRDPAAPARPEWQMRWFDQWLGLAPYLPAMHLNAYEAEAYCHWAGRRLPTAAEWEYAATQCRPHKTAGGGSFHWGYSVWEWTADGFQPYPGFAPGPYREYSAPWFDDHRELRGGAFATHARLHDARYRNFFLPNRTDIFSGFGVFG